MQRIPEPELMNDPRQARAYADADFSEPHSAFVEGVAGSLGGRQPGLILDLGCGPGDMAERLASRFPDSRIIAIDGADAMLTIAKERAVIKGLHNRIDYRQVCLPAASLGHNYDLIVSNSLLHHLRDAGDLWLTIKQSGSAGTGVYVMDLVRPESDEAALRLVASYAADEPEILQHDFYRSLLAAYRPEEVRRQLVNAGLDLLEVNVTSDRHMVISGALN